MRKHPESLREKIAYRANAREWARSLSKFDIHDSLNRRRHCFPKYAIEELIKEEGRRKNK